jgi:xanthine dehydrogenase accessory factor
MNPWIQLKQWADQGRDSLSIILVNGEEPGLSAVMERPGAEPCGPLTGANFWAADWAELRKIMASSPPEAGLLQTVGGRQYYIAAVSPPPSALVLGGGHVGRAVGQLLRFLEFDVTLMDDRAEFLKEVSAEGMLPVEAKFEDLNSAFPTPNFQAVIIVTRGHAQDTAALRQVLAWPQFPPYVGMIGSRKRAAETLAMLAAEGFPQDRLKKVHTPIGLSIGAQTPREIAISIVAELVGS